MLLYLKFYSLETPYRTRNLHPLGIAFIERVEVSTTIFGGNNNLVWRLGVGALMQVIGVSPIVNIKCNAGAGGPLKSLGFVMR